MQVIILTNYVEEKIKIRYYLIKTKNYYLYSFSKEFMLSLYNELIVLAGISALEQDFKYGSTIIFSYPNSTDFIINLTESNATDPIIKFYENCKIENNLFGHIFKGIQIIDFSTGLKLIRDDNKKEILKNNLIPNNINIELFLTKDIVNLQKKARIEYAMVSTEPEYENYNQYASNIDNDFCKENEEDNCDDEKNYFKKQSYIGRTSYCDIILNSEEFINECEEHCIVCSKNDNSECIICEYNYELSRNNTKKCFKINKIESTELDIPITDSLKEELKETSILPKLTNIPLEITDASSKITNSSILFSEFTNFPKESEPTNISSEMMKSSELEIISTEIMTMKSEMSTDYSEMKNKLTYSSMVMDNLTNLVSGINSELETSAMIKENNSYYFNSTKQEIIKEKILNKNYTQENIIIREENFIVQLSTYEYQYNYNIPNISSIDLGECEKKLKKSENIPSSQSLIIFKTDILIKELSTTYALYEVYNPLTLEKLNLSVCINDKIRIDIPVELNSNIKKLYNSLNELGYNLFNENYSFYQDICTTYTSENKTDILLSDRKKDIYMEGQSQPICQKGCKLSSYDSQNK